MDLGQLQQAFLAADKAGDTESAGVLAQALKSAMAQPPPAEYKPPPSAAGTFARTLGLQQVPVAAGVAGFGAGAAAGAELGALAGPAAPVAIPVLGLIGGVGGAAVAAYGASKAQKKILEQIPDTAKALGIDEESMAAGEKAHPWAAKSAELLSQLEGFKPSLKAFKSTKDLAEAAAKEIWEARRAAAANAAIGAVTDAGQQAIAGQPIDLKSVAESAALGAVLQNPTRYGKMLMGAGEHLVPGHKPTENLPAQSEVPPTPASSPSSEGTAAISAGSVDPIKQVLDHVKSEAKSTPVKIAGDTGLSTTEVKKHLADLKSDGVVAWDNDTRQWKATGKEPTPVPTAPSTEALIDGVKSPEVTEGAWGPVGQGSGLKPGWWKNHQRERSEIPQSTDHVPLPFEGESNVPRAGGSEPNVGGPSAGVRLPMEVGDAREAVPQVPVGGGVADAAGNAPKPDGGAQGVGAPLITEAGDTRARTPPLTAVEAHGLETMAPGERAPKPPEPPRPASELAPKPVVEPEPYKYTFTQRAMDAVKRGNLGEALYHLMFEAGGDAKPGKEASPLRDLARQLFNVTEDVKSGGADKKPLDIERNERAVKVLATRAPEPSVKAFRNWRDVFETNNERPANADDESRFRIKYKEDWARKNQGQLTSVEKARLDKETEELSKKPEYAQKYEEKRLIKVPHGSTFDKATGDFRALPQGAMPAAMQMGSFGNAKVHVEGVTGDEAANKRLTAMHHTGTKGQYDSKTNTFYFLRAGLNDRTILHEMTHAATTRVLHDFVTGNFKNLSHDQVTGAEHITRIYNSAKLRFGGRWPEALKNPFEFVAYGLTHEGFQRDLATMRSPSLEKYTKFRPIKDMFNQFVDAISRMLGIKRGEKSGNALLELIHASKDISALPKKGTDVAPLAERKQAEPHEDRSIEQQEEDRAQTDKVLNKDRNLWESFKHTFGTYTGHEQLITDLQNSKRYLYKWGQNMVTGGKDTTLHYLVDTAQSRGHDADVEMQPHVTALNKAVGEYGRAVGLKGEALEQHLQSLAYGLHERERRESKFVETAPLNKANKKYNVNGKMESAADYRDMIMDKLSKPGLKPGEAKQLYDVARHLVDPASGNLDPQGFSPAKGNKSIDVDSIQYNVVGKYSKAELQAQRDLVDKMKAEHPDEFNKLVDSKRKPDDAAKELDRKSGLWTEPTDNIVNGRGWKNYMTFKGSDKDLSGVGNQEKTRQELARMVNPFEGRRTDSENPFTQSVIDSARAASRVGFNDITTEIARLTAVKTPGFKKVGSPIKFEDRGNISEKDIQDKQTILHSLPNGDVQKYRITDKQLAEAVKGTFHDINPLFKGLGQLTGAIGRLHTRYNIAFAPYNFIRHAMTSSLMVGAEKGIGTMAQIQARVASIVASTISGGGLARAMRMARLYEIGDTAKMEELANTGHPFYKDMYEYLKTGGFIKFQESFDMRGKKLIESVGPSKVATTLDHINQYFDIWNDTFEFAGRAAAYAPIRDNILTRMKGEGHDTASKAVQDRAKLEAVAYTKNLFNYSQVGKYGREAGSVYMFLRPAMTTAVRSIDAISPAFRSAESLKPYLPKAVQDDPAAYQKFVDAHNKQAKGARLMLMSMMGMGAGLYVLAHATAETDDQGRNKIATDDMELWTRNVRLPLHGLGGKDNDYLQIPWGFGLGAWGALGAQLASVVAGNQSFGKALANMITPAMDSYLPLPVAKFDPVEHPFAWLGLSVAPTFARPALEYAMNVDEFGKEIYNSRNSAFGDAYVGGDNLPELYGMTTRFLADQTNGGVNISPNTLHFFTNNYIDGASRILHNGLGIGMTLAGQKDFDPKRDLVVLDSFLGKSSSYDARELAEVESKIKKEDSIIKMFSVPGREDQLDKYRDANPNAEMAVKIYNQQLGSLNNVRHRMKEVSNSDMSPKDKQDELRELRKNRDWIARDIIDSVQDYL